MSRKLSVTAIFEPVEDGWTQARIAELPAVITAAPSLEEAKEFLLDALYEYLLSLEQSAPSLEAHVLATRESLDILVGHHFG